jgi:signal recognition particle subunit SRP54
MTGQQALEIAKTFHERVGFDGAILTKADSESRCGSAVAFRYLLKKPIAMLGTGEKIDALQQFFPERIAQRIIGLGDLQSLIEKADEVINPKDQVATVEAMMSGKYTLDDFAKQLDMIKSMGSLQNIMSYLPGMGGMKITPDMIEKGEAESKKFRVIIQSMTPGERKTPKIIEQSRKKRIAKGCGLTVDDIDILLKRFEETSQFAKLLKKSNFSHLLKR